MHITIQCNSVALRHPVIHIFIKEVRDVKICGELLYRRKEEIMQISVNNATLELVHGDITQQAIDAIVNAANPTLLGGGGVDGAIHRGAGPQLLEECRTLGGCETGDAKITKGYNLKAKHVIHTVGPVYRRDGARAVELLSSAYRRSLEVASWNGLQSIAFPSISTGAYGYPLDEAAPIALGTVLDYMMDHPEIDLVRFVLFDSKTLGTYEEALEKLQLIS
jgi:O-acetyl-ADP-ribose deacetylase (regulator of RNase III)